MVRKIQLSDSEDSDGDVTMTSHASPAMDGHPESPRDNDDAEATDPNMSSDSDDDEDAGGVYVSFLLMIG
jgi:hypothetical protein